jgi:hypothetical protein
MQNLRFQREYPAAEGATVKRFEVRSAPAETGAVSGEMFTEGGVKVAAFSLSSPAGTSVVRFSFEHRSVDDGRHVWQVTLVLHFPTPEEAEEEPGCHAEVADVATDVAPMVRLAAEFWTHWYRTGTALDHALLHRVLGVWAPLDAVVALLSLHDAERYADAIVSKALDGLAGDALATRDGARGKLTAELSKRLPELRDVIAPANAVRADELEQGIPAWDARLARWLDGEKQKGMANALRKMSAKSSTPWAAWLPMSDGQPPTIRLALAATAIWKNHVRPAIEREDKSKPHHVRVNVTASGDAHARFPKMTAPMSWAFGAPGKEVRMQDREVGDAPLDDATTTEVDGQRFASVPLVGQRALVPRSWSLLPHDRDKYPHQTSLPMAIDEQEALPVVVSQNQGVVMSTVAGKLALLIFASPDVQCGEMSYLTLGELTRLVYPSGRIQQREVATTMAAVNELDKLFLYLPDGRKLRIFDVTQSWAPDRAGPSMRIHYGLTRTFLGAFEEVKQRTFSRSVLQGQEYTGDFLMNLDGMLSLPNNKPALLRYYTRACALWNAACVTGKYDPAKVTPATPEEWAIRANTLSHGVAEYMEAKAAGESAPDRRRQLSAERKNIADDLDDLATRGLVVLSKSSKAGTVRVLPPENWLEARAMGRESGTRPYRLAADVAAGDDD